MKKVGLWCKRKKLVSISEHVSLETYFLKVVTIQMEVGLRRSIEERKQLTGCPMPNIIPATL
jgi:hypothetical protein